MSGVENLSDSDGETFRREARHDSARLKANRHSRNVKLLKALLPVLALASIIGFFAVAWLKNTIGDQISVAGATIEDGKLVMDNPKMEGVTNENQPYRVVANRALQSINGDGEITLEGIVADVPFSGTERADIIATGGIFNNTLQTMVLDDGLTVTTQGGLKAILQSANINMATGSLITDDPVDITRQGTHIVAQSMEIQDNGKVLVFQTRVKVKIIPNAMDK